MKSFKNTFYEGLVFCVPAVLTGWIFYKIFRTLYLFIAAGTAYIPPSFYREYPWIKSALEAGIVLVMLLGIILSGVIAETFIGRFLRKKFDTLFRSIPFVNFIYDIFKQIFDVLFMNSENLLSRPVLVPFPYPGKLAIGFMTGTAEPVLAEEKTKEYVKVFVPTVPIPTTGFLMIFPKDTVVEGALTTEEALRLILSGGILEESGKDPEKK
jgi:uncharacterized membrane protein